MGLFRATRLLRQTDLISVFEAGDVICATGSVVSPPAAATTVRSAVPEIGPSVAVMVAVPGATPDARPAASIVAVPVALLVQVTEAVRSPQVPSANTPVAR